MNHMSPYPLRPLAAAVSATIGAAAPAAVLAQEGDTTAGVIAIWKNLVFTKNRPAISGFYLDRNLEEAIRSPNARVSSSEVPIK